MGLIEYFCCHKSYSIKLYVINPYNLINRLFLENPWGSTCTSPKLIYYFYRSF